MARVRVRVSIQINSWAFHTRSNSGRITGNDCRFDSRTERNFIFRADVCIYNVCIGESLMLF